MFHSKKIRSKHKVATLLMLLQLSLAVTIPQSEAASSPTEEHMQEGARLLRLGDVEGSLDEYLLSCYSAKHRYNPEGWLAAGRCFKTLKRWSKAIECLSTHLAQTKDTAPDANCDLAECYMETGQFEKSARCTTQARIEADHNNPRPYYTMGMLEERLGHFDKALELYTTALGEQPWTFTKAWEGRARCFRKKKPADYKAALSEYKKMIEALLRDLDWVEVYYGMAECHYYRGDHPAAIDHLLEMLKRNPDDLDGKRLLDEIERRGPGRKDILDPPDTKKDII